MEKILIIDDEVFIRENVSRILTEDGYQVCQAANSREACEQVATGEIDLALLDLNLGPENGIDLLKELKELDPELLVIVITGFGSVESAVDTLKMGAFHYMKKPFKADALKIIVKLALQTQTLKREVRNLKRADSCIPGRSPMIGRSKPFRDIIDQVREIARIPSTVLITGESGTGKELIARAVHDLSDRTNSAFVAINCASIPASLLESELFGHEKGSFTNATGRKTGLFEEAHHGTIFLDEIGEMDLPMQVKLLRVLQERTIRRVGGIKDIMIDVRIIAATNRNLMDGIANGTFREDLYYRINVFPIHIPPLRQRREDISLIASYFLDTFSRSFGRDFKELSPAAATLLEEYSWPGNIRELRNVIERICIMNYGPTLLPQHLPQELQKNSQSSSSQNTESSNKQVPLLENGLDDAVMNFEKNIISQALTSCIGNVVHTATLLKIPRGTLRYKMEKYGL